MRRLRPDIPLEMDDASLPRNSACAAALMVVAEDQLDALQPTFQKPFQQIPASLLSLAACGFYCQPLAKSLFVDADNDQAVS